MKNAILNTTHTGAFGMYSVEYVLIVVLVTVEVASTSLF